MSPDDFNAFCATLPATTYVSQWGGAHVWKVGGKVFAIGRDVAEGMPGKAPTDGSAAVTFKASDLAFEMLKSLPGCRPAPYMASRGLKWIQRVDASELSDDDLRGYLAASHRLVASGLSKKQRAALGL